MAVSPTYPGVYVQEIPSGVRTIVGVATSIGMFLGTAKKGPINTPVRCTSYLDYARAFGEDPTGGELVRYVKLFFLNGGSDCYVMRIASGAVQTAITLNNEAGAPTLVLQAKDAGQTGNFIRAVVTYGGAQPEVTFNLELFRIVINSSGQRVKTEGEVWNGLSMDSASASFAEDVLTQNSKLVNAQALGVAPLAQGFSLSGRVVAAMAGFAAIFAVGGNFQISIDGSPFFNVDLTAVAASAAAIKAAIDAVFTLNGFATTKSTVSFVAGPPGIRLQIASAGTGDVFIRPAQSGPDLAVPLMLGTSQGGIEVSSFSNKRPAPTGLSTVVTAGLLNAFANTGALAVNSITLEGIDAPTGAILPVPVPLSIETVVGGKVFTDATPAASSPNGNSDGVREKLALIAQQINSFNPGVPTTKFVWTAQVWGSRLGIQPGDIFDENYLLVGPFAAATAGFKGIFQGPNVHNYRLGIGGVGAQGAPVTGNDGGPPTPASYTAAYDIIDKEVDLYNLMILAPDATVTVQSLYANASIRCSQRRAFLIMDPPTAWTDAQTASTGVNLLRTGLVKDYSAVYFPFLTMDEDGRKVDVGPAGAVAGLYARIDGTRGVWKAPAGTEADLRGITGLRTRLSDGENGIVNPRAVNAIRVFPNGIVNWGARTMDGDDAFASEYKYIPIRRLALYIEESLYRGLKWVVFEPNDEPLWSQVRLNVGAFMHNLFRQGAFQGTTPRDAYFVKCDRETTTQNDRNLGIVNIYVGFAPLKPAEFVILYLQQMAGQIEV